LAKWPSKVPELSQLSLESYGLKITITTLSAAHSLADVTGVVRYFGKWQELELTHRFVGPWLLKKERTFL